ALPNRQANFSVVDFHVPNCWRKSAERFSSSHAHTLGGPVEFGGSNLGQREHRHGPVSLALTKEEGRMSGMEFMLALLLHTFVSARCFESRPNVKSEKPSLVDRNGGVGAEHQTAPDFTITELNGRRFC